MLDFPLILQVIIQFIQRNEASGIFYGSGLLMQLSAGRLSPVSILRVCRQHFSSIRMSLISLKTSQSHNEKLSVLLIS